MKRPTLLLLLSILFLPAAAQRSLEPFVSGGIFNIRPSVQRYAYQITENYYQVYAADGRVHRPASRPFVELGLLWHQPFAGFRQALHLSVGYHAYDLRRTQRNLLEPGWPDSSLSTRIGYLRIWPGVSANGRAGRRLRLHATIGPSVWVPLQGADRIWVGAAGEVGVRYDRFLLRAGLDLGLNHAATEDLAGSMRPAFRNRTLFAGLTVYAGRWKL